MEKITYEVDINGDKFRENISDDVFSEAWEHIEEVINFYAEKGLYPRIGEKYVTPVDEFDYTLIVKEIVYCSHKIMINLDLDT